MTAADRARPRAGAMTLTLRYAALSDVGLIRTGNEDCGYAGPRLLAVADGMGGHAAGEVASAVAIAALSPLDEDAPGADLLEALRTAALRANDSLRELVAGDGQLDGMGTTLTALLFTGSRLGLLHIGDSRAYLLRDGVLSQITHDDTLVQSLVDEGRISEDEAGSHPQRSLITRALDGRDDVDLDTSVREVRAGDRYLLCTDGLSGPVGSRDTMLEALAAARPAGGRRAAGRPRAARRRARQRHRDRRRRRRRRRDRRAGGRRCGRRVTAARAGAHHRRRRRARRARPSRHPPAPAPRPTGRAPAPARGRGRSHAALALTVAVVLALAAGAGWLYVRSQCFVGADAAQVAIFRGVTGSVAGLDLSSVERRTDLSVEALSELDRVGVERGIAARDADDAAADRRRSCRTAPPRRPRRPPAPTTPPPAPVSTAGAARGSAVPAHPPRRARRDAPPPRPRRRPAGAPSWSCSATPLVLSLAGYAAVGLAVDGRIPSGVLGYGAGLGGLFLLAHLVVRGRGPVRRPADRCRAWRCSTASAWS